MILTSSPAIAHRFPLTDVQAEIWLACQLGPEMSCAYNDASVTSFRGPLNIEVVRNSLDHVVARHEAFRLTFAADGSSQRMMPIMRLEIPVVDWTSLEAPTQNQRLAHLLTAEMSTPFDFARGPLLRARIIRLAREDHRLVICAHHLVCDGWTWSLLQGELGQLYSAHIEARPCDLPEPTPFSTFAADYEEGPDAEAYWLQQFAVPPPPLALPFDHPRLLAFANPGAFAALHLSPSLLQALRLTGARRGATLFTVLLAALHVLLQRLSGQRQTVVAICSAGQNRPGAENVAGHCVNLLPIYDQASADRPFTEHLAEINQLLQAALAHEDYSYGKLLHNLPVPRPFGSAPLVNAVLTFAPPSESAFAGLVTEETYAPKSFVNFDLLFAIRETSGGLAIEVNYNRALLEPATVQRWLGHFHVLLEAITAKPQAMLSALPPLRGD